MEKLKYPGSLHGHTEYSNLDIRDATNRIPDLINYAIELGQEVIAFTEHETVCNAIKIEKYYNKIKAEHPNFKVIKGNEIYLTRNGLARDNVQPTDRFYHFILLAKDEIGHRQIRELSTRAWNRSWRIGKMTRRPTYYQDLIDIIGKEPGHVIGSTACLGGFFAVKCLEWAQCSYDDSFKSKIVTWLNSMIKIFGEGNFYLEMQPAPNKEQQTVNKAILTLSKELSIPYIITCDEHYLKKEDRPIHKAFLKAQEGEREVDEFYETTYLMDTDELENYMSEYMSEEDFQMAYQNIIDIKNKCVDYSLLRPLKIPSLMWKEPSPIPTDRMDFYRSQIPYIDTFLGSNFEGDQRMVKLIINKLESDERLRNKEHYDMINSNLRSTWVSSEVNKTHWSAYFLNLQKNIEECWNAGTIVGPGRGSGVGFLLLYLLDITQINPLWETTATFEWRFLNPDRVSVLDIDTDIEGGRRATVLQHLRDVYGADRVANVLTFGTEGTKSCIQTAARGLGIDNDEALYIASLVPSDRGMARTLKQCYYGDEENGFEPVGLFVHEMNNHPDLWKVAQEIEGLVCRVGEHAGGVIFVDEPFTNSTALMKVPNGDTVTQFDLHDCEDASLIKIDLLSVEALDKIHNCLDLLCEYGKIEKKATLKETYDSVLGIYDIERKDLNMWKMVWEHKIQSLFQMEKQSGIQGIAILKPTSVDDLAILNSTIRLMAQDGATEMPTEKLARFKRNPNAWDREMGKWGLGEEEKKILEPVVGISYGLCIAQEQFMQLVQLPELGGFSLTWADKLRKSIAKKNPKEFDNLTDEFYKVTKQKGIKENFARYVWEVLISMSKGYGFNQSHTLAYSLVALQEMNLAYKYPIIYWNTACLITDTGGSEEVEGNKSTDYSKLADGINKMRSSGINIALPDINKSNYTFKVDEENNKIIFGLRGILGVGDAIIENIIANRPYSSWEDFKSKVKVNKTVMLSLIKGGTFDELEDRVSVMKKFIMETADTKKNLTIANVPLLMANGLLPLDTEGRKLSYRVYEFNRYLKNHCTNKLDERAVNFLIEIDCEDMIEDGLKLNAKKWKKEYDNYLDTFRDYISKNKKDLLDKVNQVAFNEEWNNYAQGTLSAWEMEALCFYYHEHELTNVNNELYGISDFFTLPEDPVVERTINIRGKEVNIFKLTKIAGTCISKNKNKGTVKLLTTSGVVEVRFRKEYFSLFDKRITETVDGKKKIKEYSWFDKGEKILVNGMRQGDQFSAKKYASQGGHQLYRITSVVDDKITLQTERAQGDAEDDE